jgi:hypothetical protein
LWHCSGPSDTIFNDIGWVENQQSCKKKLDRGEPGDGMTAAQAAKLTALGGVQLTV